MAEQFGHRAADAARSFDDGGDSIRRHVETLGELVGIEPVRLKKFLFEDFAGMDQQIRTNLAGLNGIGA
jgi:hypothetical protein